MPVRRTESRVPAGLQASDLGHAVAAPDGRFTLVSFFPSPLVTTHSNGYVLFVTDAGLACPCRKRRSHWSSGVLVLVDDASDPVASSDPEGFEVGYLGW